MGRANEGGRLAYADLLRVAAMLAVIMNHAAAGWLESLPVGTGDWHALNLWDSLSRWAVPVFVMCSGMFLLDPKRELSWSSLFFRRLLRLGTALVVWGVIYQLYGGWQSGSLGPGSLLSALRSVLLGSTETHLWFLPMMAGLYLLTPILRAFVRGAKRSDFHWFFLLYAVFMLFLPLFLRLRGSETAAYYADRLYLNFNAAYPPLAYVGYYVAGYYFKTYPLRRPARLLLYALGLVGLAVTAGGTFLLSRQAGGLSTALYSNLSLNVAAMSAALFVFFRCVLDGTRLAGSALVRTLSEVSFGVYLCHILFLHILRGLGLGTLPLPAILGAPLLSLLILLPSFALSWLLHKLPLVGRYIT